jgi:hypothetical protein
MKFYLILIWSWLFAWGLMAQQDSIILQVKNNQAIVTINEIGFYQVKVLNLEGALFYSKQLEAPFRKVFDFSLMDDGQYQVKIYNWVENTVWTHDFEKQAGYLITTKIKDYDPIVIDLNSDNILTVSTINLTEHKIRIAFYEGENSFYQEEIEDCVFLNKRYDLNQLRKGYYMVVISLDHYTFFQEIMITKDHDLKTNIIDGKIKKIIILD